MIAIFIYCLGYLITFFVCVVSLFMTDCTKYSITDIILMLIWAPLLWPYTWYKYSNVK